MSQPQEDIMSPINDPTLFRLLYFGHLSCILFVCVHDDT